MSVSFDAEFSCTKPPVIIDADSWRLGFVTAPTRLHPLFSRHIGLNRAAAALGHPALHDWFV